MKLKELLEKLPEGFDRGLAVRIFMGRLAPNFYLETNDLLLLQEIWSALPEGFKRSQIEERIVVVLNGKSALAK